MPANYNITGLSRDTTYHYRIVAENSLGESLGGDQTFRTTIVYVEPYGTCGGNAPCYSGIQDAIDAADSGGTIKIAEESYYEDVAIGVSGNVWLEGGWNASFTARSSVAESLGTAMTGTLVIGSEMEGTVLVDCLVLQAEPILSPTATTGSATSVTSGSATLNGTVNPNGTSTTYYFQYGTTTSYGSTTSSTSAGSGSSDVSVSAGISSLSCNTVYHYRLVANNSGGTSYGSDKAFTADTCPPQAGPIPDTGQTKCYNDSSEITCPQPGQYFYGQDANYTINPPSYTKLDSNGNTLSASATLWSMVKDNVTGLIWEVKTDDGSIHAKYNTYTWQNAQDVFIATLNSAGYGGYTDWRLPTIKELAYIVNYGIYGPAIDTGYFPNTVSANYWSSTTRNGYTGYAWVVNFKYGLDFDFGNKSSGGTIYVRAVRGGQ